jgi:hypothetical protein
MTGTLRKGLTLLVLVFVIFYMFTDPSGLAEVAKQGGSKGWTLLTDLFNAVIQFLDDLRS